MKRNLLTILFIVGINHLCNAQSIDSTNELIPVDPVYFLDEVRINDEEFRKVKPKSIAVVEVLKDSSAIKVLGEEGKNGVIYITSINHAREKYIRYLRSKSTDYANIIRSIEDESNVVYVLNHKILGKENAGDLYLINDEVYLDLRILNKAELKKEYKISHKDFGIIISTKQNEKE